MNRSSPSLWRLLAAVVLLALPGLRAADSISSLKLLLLDAAVGGGGVIAVGEHGSIFRSTDHARTWQAVTPTGVVATLTAISLSATVTPTIVAEGSTLNSVFSPGWGVGHDAIILHTRDGGKTWAKQFQGEDHNDSFLDVLALDTQHAIAVGAYGLFYETKDGGKTWSRRKLGEDDYHFNRITRGPTGTLYLAGEHGTLLRSTDQGANWTPIRTPYEGSFYGILPLEARTLLAYGLRGRVYRSMDDGATWTAIPTPEPSLLATAIRLKDGTLVLAGQARTLLVSRDAGVSLTAVSNPPTTAIAELIELANGNLLALGEAGATVLEVGRVIPNAPPQDTRTPAAATIPTTPATTAR